MAMVYRSLFYGIGLLILSFGATLTIKANLGAGPWDALNVGLSALLGLTIGSWIVIIGILLIFVNALLLMRKPELLSLFTVFILGFFVDFWMAHLTNVFNYFLFLNQLLLLIAGLAIIGLGIATYLQASFPLNPIDEFMVSLQERFGLNIMASKLIGEVLALVFAFLVNGPIGVGTVIIALGIGPAIQVFHPLCCGIMDKLALK
ncbi:MULTISPECIES: membrane protein [Bacillaceae]|uniref:YczE/YyaS/YitT family protein n=1 Tax=Bacillaceae TaxID=186817 RepID=UPI001786D904|nr:MULTISPECIES: membrane protein [Bacillaceae]MBE0313586.1 membrane protein [Xanthomonas citri pv. punicae]MCE4050071.1 membrane protein [Bacillus sp. Au-Bac7]MCM3031482.1 membrane protein [Niallia sp. MER 6]MDL0435564.1 membrane protein [Niallia sp. SS-2023]UPO88124.1 membrane protein [Niallia sp. Man26]